MTPDEVVKVLEEYFDEANVGGQPNKYLIRKQQALTSAITQIQDYQKLRERVSVATLAFQFYCLDFPDTDKQELLADWQGYSERLRMNYAIKAQSIVTYLHQPTEH